MYSSTREFVEALDRAGELARVRVGVSPVQEIGAIADAMSKRRAPHAPSRSAQINDPRFCHLGGKALLFESVSGSDFPLLINAWGSYRRMEMALGCAEGTVAGHTPGGFDALAGQIAELVKPQPPRSFRELIAAAKRFLPLLKIPPKRRRGLGECQQVIHLGENADVTTLPIIRCWQNDGDYAALGYPPGINDHIPGLGRGEAWERDYRGRYITLAGIHTVHADDRDDPKPASHNIGMYRVQLLGKRTLAMHWHMHHDGARHWRSWKKLGKRMPVAIVLGGESVMPYAATAPLPPGISELLLAGFLNRGGIEMVRAQTVPLWIPANAEIVIEGYVSAEAGEIGFVPRAEDDRAAHAGARENIDRFGLGPGAVFEGPFGDHTGFYSLPDRYPLLEVTAITHRRGAIYPTTIVGLPPQEDYFLGKATERLFLPLLKTLIHDIEDYDLPMFGTFHNCAALRIKKAYPLQGRRVMHSVWGAGQMAWTKSIFVVDDDVNVHDTMSVLKVAGEQCHPLRDVELVNGPLDILDHAAPRLGAGMKIGFDCTRKIPGEEVAGVPVTPSAALAEREAQKNWAEAHANILNIPGVLSASRAPTPDGGFLLVRITKAEPTQGRRILQLVMNALSTSQTPRFVIVFGAQAPENDIDAMFFHWLAHSDASRDMLRWQSPDGLVHRMGFDATPKMPGDEHNGQPVRDWPPLLKVDDATRALITKRWREYGFDE